MEQDLNQFKENEFNYYKVEHKNQKLKNISEFQNWYENANKYVKNQNLKRGHWDSFHNVDNSLLTMSFCDKCQSYAICDFTKEYSCIRCTNCNYFFCPGCYREEHFDVDNDDDKRTLCLKGYIKLLYLRIKYRRSGIMGFDTFIVIIHVLFCLLFTPLYLGFLSNIVGFCVHSRRGGIFHYNLYDYTSLMFIYCVLRGLVMIPYITLFFPFMLIILFPSIFNKKYYYMIYQMYIAALEPDCYRLDYDT